jgi:hypothetical protein
MNLREIITRAWNDAAFKRDLLSNPKDVIEASMGVTLPAEVRIYVHEDSDTDIHLVLPRSPGATRK